MGFWVRNLIFGVILAITAYVLLVNKDMLKFLIDSVAGDDEPVAEQVVEEQQLETTSETEAPEKTTVEKKPKKQEKKSTNAAAEGLSRFYASINPTFKDGNGPRVRENIVYLPEPKGDLTKILKARAKTTRPLRKNWQGDREARPFRVGETLYQKLSEYANEQGVEVMWWLNRDFLVKDPFRIDQNIVKTAYQVGKAVSGHFEEGIDIYFCYKHRTLVLIAQKDPYLEAECTLVNNKKAAW